MRKTESESKGPGEFVFFALEFLPDELFLISIVIGAVFGLIWLIREALSNELQPITWMIAKGAPRCARGKEKA